MFYRIFIENFQNVLKTSQKFAFFVQTQKDLTGFVKLFEKHPQIIHFSHYSWEIFWIFSKGSPRKDPGYANDLCVNLGVREPSSFYSAHFLSQKGNSQQRPYEEREEYCLITELCPRNVHKFKSCVECQRYWKSI